MLTQALGLIETIGLAAAIEAADTAVKSSNVKLIGYELTKGDGMVTIKIEGNVAAVQAAIHAAKAAAEKVSGVYSTQVIPRPARGLETIVLSKDTIGISKDPEPASEALPEKPEAEQLITLEAVAQESEEAVIQIAEETVTQTSEEVVAQISEEIITQTSEETVAQKAEDVVIQTSEEQIKPKEKKKVYRKKQNPKKSEEESE